MFSRANKVPNKWITKRNIKNSLISSQNVQNLKANLKNDPVNAKNAEITNYVIMHIFNEVASNTP